VLVLSIMIVAIGVWPYILHISLDPANVPLASTIAAGSAFILSLIYLIIRPKKESYWPGFFLFLLLGAAITLLVGMTGGISSAYAPAFILLAIFAGLFGFYGVVPVLAVVLAYATMYYSHEQLSAGTLIVLIANSLFPLIIGFIVWDKFAEGNLDSATHKENYAENALSEVTNRSEVVINAIGDGVVAVDAVGTIQLINPAAQTLLGWPKQDAMALSYQSVLRLIDRQNKPISEQSDPVKQALNTNQEVRTNQLTVVTKAEKKLALAMVVSPLGELGSGVIIVFRDITKEKQEEREQAEFVSTASHEMRTPVASIEGYLGLTLNPQTAQIDARARNFINKAHESAQHLGRLFQDLLDVTKADDGRMANIPRVIDLIPYIHDIVHGLDVKAQEKGLRLVFKPDDFGGAQKKIAPIYYVNLDGDHIREVTNNLVENAIKYTPSGTVTVDVRAAENNENVVISIQDSGIGIPTEDIPHLFQKFYRVDNADTREIGGTGLGLYLCRRLAETMGGRIWVESEYKKGSTFFVELPRIDNETAERLKQQQATQVVATPLPQTPPVIEQSILMPTPQQPAAVQPNGVRTMQPTLTPAPAPLPTSQAAATPQQAVQTAPSATMAPNPTVKPATTVPRGESLTREQIAAHVARLEALAKAQRSGTPPAPPAR